MRRRLKPGQGQFAIGALNRRQVVRPIALSHTRTPPQIRTGTAAQGQSDRLTEGAGASGDPPGGDDAACNPVEPEVRLRGLEPPRP
jgi:hypothetical protein